MFVYVYELCEANTNEETYVLCGPMFTHAHIYIAIYLYHPLLYTSLLNYLRGKSVYQTTVFTIIVNERCRRKEERSKQGHTNNKAKQHSTPKAVTFPKKNELPLEQANHQLSMKEKARVMRPCTGVDIQMLDNKYTENHGAQKSFALK